MNHSCATLTLAGLFLFTVPGFAQAPAPIATVFSSSNVNSTGVLALTPAQMRVATAQGQIKANASKVQAWNDLALAYLERARETEDSTYYEDASKALARGFALDPADFQLLKTQVALSLGLQQYAKAEQQATVLNHRTPDDVMTYGYLAEAEIALREYPAAEKNAQWMLNMRPNNVPGLLLGARLRAQYEDPGGALEFLRLAYAETSPIEVEQLAWIANQMASVQIGAGHPEAALPFLDRADQLFPQYPYTLHNRSRIRSPQGTTRNAGTASASSAAVALPDPTSGAGIAPKPLAVNTSLAIAPQPFAPVAAALLVPLPTTTERVLHTAQTTVTRNPKDAQAYAALGAAYFQQARETGDVSDYELAEKALHLSLDIVSSDFSAEGPLESLAEVCMGEHRFADALTSAQRALSLGSGDVSPFAIVGDAQADMGEYDRAALAYARLTPPDMTLAPRAAYARDSRMAYLSFIAGNTADAIRLMKTSVSEGIAAQLPQENLAWLYYELGDFFSQAGDALSANSAYLTALETHPGDYRALAGLAKLRATNGRHAEAIELYQRAIAVVPMPIFIADLGDLYARSGKQVDADKQYQLVEYIGRLGKINQVLHNRDLALFYADHDLKLPEALTLAQKEFEVRHDIYTWDALAWALYKNGRYPEAANASAKAMHHGTRDALLIFHAGMIAAKSGHGDAARRDFAEALAINPHFHLLYARVAEQQLAAIKTQLASGAVTATHAQ